MNKPWKVVLAFAGVFVAGAIFGGAIAPRWLHFDRPGMRPPFAEAMMERLDQQLNLSDEQKAKIEPIVRRMADETQRMRREGAIAFRAMMDNLNAEIAVELTPEQRVKHEEMRRKIRERIERFRERPRPPEGK